MAVALEKVISVERQTDLMPAIFLR